MTERKEQDAKLKGVASDPALKICVALGKACVPITLVSYKMRVIIMSLPQGNCESQMRLVTGRSDYKHSSTLTPTLCWALCFICKTDQVGDLRELTNKPNKWNAQ